VVSHKVQRYEQHAIGVSAGCDIGILRRNRVLGGIAQGPRVNYAPQLIFQARGIIDSQSDDIAYMIING